MAEHDLSDLVDPHLVITVMEPFKSPRSVGDREMILLVQNKSNNSFFLYMLEPQRDL